MAASLKELAADKLEAAVADLEIADGKVRIAGTDRAHLLCRDRRASAAPPRTKLTATESFAPPNATYPNGTHACEVEIDPDTGETTIVRYSVVDDFGFTLNPLLLAGQVHGGIAQGAGQALMERAVFDRDGQLLTASFLDYCMPRADNLPAFDFETRNVPSTTNPMGLKGAGEAGSIGSTPAVMNAVADALWRAYRIEHIDMPRRRSPCTTRSGARALTHSVSLLRTAAVGRRSNRVIGTGRRAIARRARSISPAESAAPGRASLPVRPSHFL